MTSTDKNHWIAGLDEAGYGPWLGPMVIGFVSLKAKKGTSPSAPWDLVPNLGRAGRREKGIISVADSKKLHRPGKGDLTRLEEAVLAFVTIDRGESPKTFRELIDHLTAGRSDYLDLYPWYQNQDLPLPFSAEPIDLSGKSRKLERGLEAAGMEVGEVRAIPLEVQEFNSEVSSRGSKGAVDAWAMGRFLHWLWMIEDRHSIEVWTDRLGGCGLLSAYLLHMLTVTLSAMSWATRTYQGLVSLKGPLKTKTGLIIIG